MQHWAKLAKIKKIDYKLQGLVVSLISRPFVLIGQKLYLVPPGLDSTRSFIVKDTKEIKDNLIVFPEGNFKDYNFEGEYLLIDENCIEKVEAKKVYDKKLGLLGDLKYIDDSTAQSKLIVDYQGREIIIPLVDEICKIDKDITVDLPEGLLDL